ncbi:MAG: CDP-diacylglycerol--glycerol-3-phosphate 3-phosphatidyltransferase [bacterium]|nr:CDP-diacylglycerol--glycerol-3-phosphate 3-phosphatidyltransferase [bacterium]
MDKTLRNLPNILTISRLFLVPVFVFLMIDPSEQMVLIATGIFVLASITDFFDGFIARKFKVVSDTGKLLDPLADKILVMAALVMLVAQRSDIDGSPWVPEWMVVIILAREMWVTGLRGIAASKGNILAAGAGGKWKSALQMFAITCLLIHHPLMIAGIAISTKIIGINILVLSIFFALWSAGEYTVVVMGGKIK